MIGAILGEWFGAPHGLGLIIVGAMQNFQIPLLWSAVLLVAMASIILYGIATVLETAAYRRFR
jgi:NitT/TauT family transport system permease protein